MNPSMESEANVTIPAGASTPECRQFCAACWGNATLAAHHVGPVAEAYARIRPGCKHCSADRKPVTPEPTRAEPIACDHFGTHPFGTCRKCGVRCVPDGAEGAEPKPEEPGR